MLLPPSLVPGLSSGSLRAAQQTTERGEKFFVVMLLSGASVGMGMRKLSLHSAV